MKGTEVPNPRCSSACDCTCMLTRMDHCLVNNSSMTFALELIWHAFLYQFILNCLPSNLFRSSHACHDMCSVLLFPVYSLFKCFRSSHACHMCLVLFLPVYSLFKCSRSSHACHVFDSVLDCSILFLTVQSLQSLFKCFRCSHGCHVFGSVLACATSAHAFRRSLTRFADFVCLFCH